MVEMSSHDEHEFDYNNLPDVEMSYQQFKNLGGESLLYDLSKPILRNNLQEVIGVCLIHKHVPIPIHNIMNQKEVRSSENDYSLITAPIDKSEANSAKPNSWIVDRSGNLMPFEYSDQSVICEYDGNELFNLPGFIELSTAIDKMKLSKVIGISINLRPNLLSDLARSNKVLLEVSDDSSCESHLSPVSFSDERLLNTIPTRWVFINRGDAGASDVEIFASCHCHVFPEGGHSGTGSCPPIFDSRR